MTIKKLATEICKREGKRKQVDIAQVSEIVGIVCDIAFEMDRDGKSFHWYLVENGKKRSKKKVKK